MSRKYTKADLEEIVFAQLENLNAMHDLLSIMKHQSELITKANKKLEQEISELRINHIIYSKARKKSGTE